MCLLQSILCIQMKFILQMLKMYSTSIVSGQSSAADSLGIFFPEPAAGSLAMSF